MTNPAPTATATPGPASRMGPGHEGERRGGRDGVQAGALATWCNVGGLATKKIFAILPCPSSNEGFDMMGCGAGDLEGGKRKQWRHL